MPESDKRKLERELQSTPDTSSHEAILVGQGLFWQDMNPGQKFRTYSRRITETDLVQFASLTGMVAFLDKSSAGALGERPVPAALTYALIEGLIIQSLIRGSGLALLAYTVEPVAPVRVEDTIHGVVEITGVRPTSRHNRAIVDSAISIFNQNEELVLRYTSKRLIAGQQTAG